MREGKKTRDTRTRGKAPQSRGVSSILRKHSYKQSQDEIVYNFARRRYT